MKSVRQGNDINVIWRLSDGSGHPYDLSGKSFAIQLVCGYENRPVTNFSIQGENHNEVHFTFLGNEQTYLGSYGLLFVENVGGRGKVTFDIKDAFSIVAHSWQTGGCNSCPSLSVNTVEISSTIQGTIGPRGYSAYEVAVHNGFIGTEDEWLDSLIGPKGDTGEAAGFGEVTAEVDANVGTPSVSVEVSGPDTAKNIHFAFKNIKGETGAQGPQGIQGETGATGPTGADGDSAYEIAVEHGFVGTEEEWLASLKGEDGSDADVTSQNIERALGYVPASPESVAEKYTKPSSGIPSTDLASGVIPDVSQFITKSVDDLVNYYLKSDTYTKAEVQALIAAISQFHYEVYASLSEVTSPANNVLYLIGPTGSGTDKYKEYVWPNATLGFVLIGDTSIDLSGYVTTQALNTALADYTATANLAAVALSGSYNDLLNKPTIPTVPEISTDIDTDGASDTKTASPKAVKSFVEGKGYGTYSKPNGGIPASDLASGVIPDVSGKEDSSNKVTSLSASSTDTEYPSAKAVYDALYENVLISLGVNSAGTASDLIGLKVTVTNADTSEQISEQTWNGTPLVVRIKAGVRYTVSVQMHLDYITPASQTFTSEIASTRSVGFIYNYSAVIDLSYRNTDGTKKMVQDTANSYVARVAGDYKLPAVYGNAIKNGSANSAAYTRQGSTYTADFVNYKGVQITSPYIETDTGDTIASAVLLWQTGTNLISNVAFSNGYVTFTVNSIPSENGLAVLAVKDSNGNIMWSWTIWLTTDTLTAEKFTNYNEVDYYLMPENLFCVWNEQRTNYGTGMIQWGRKDVMVPNIPGSGTQMTVYDIEGNAITAGTALGSVIGVFGSDNDQSADKTVANSIKNPGMFFTRYDSTNNNWNNLAWFNNFWNAAETSSSSMADNQDTAIKTIYDPCPFGWMLPAGRAFTGFTTTGGSASTAEQLNVVGSWSNGWNFKRNSEDTTGNKFVASGCRVNGSGALAYVGSSGLYWSFAPLSQAQAWGLYFISGGVNPSSNGGRAYGFAVRPSRESE